MHNYSQTVWHAVMSLNNLDVHAHTHMCAGTHTHARTHARTHAHSTFKAWTSGLAVLTLLLLTVTSQPWKRTDINIQSSLMVKRKEGFERREEGWAADHCWPRGHMTTCYSMSPNRRHTAWRVSGMKARVKRDWLWSPNAWMTVVC